MHADFIFMCEFIWIPKSKSWWVEAIVPWCVDWVPSNDLKDFMAYMLFSVFLWNDLILSVGS